MIRLPDNLEQQLGELAATVAAGCGLLSERLIPLNDAARLFPRPGGRQISKISLWRWATKGIRTPALPPGERARLATIKVGMTRYTSYEAIQRFADELDNRQIDDPGAPGPLAAVCRTPGRRRAETSVAAAQLKADGFM